MSSHARYGLAMALAGLMLVAADAESQGGESFQSVEAYRAARAEAAHRQRRMIFNNDGDDHLLGGEVSREAFLARRTTPLLGSHVDTISYCTSRPFGAFLHRTQIGDVITQSKPFRGDRTNVVEYFLERGTDPLEVMTEFAHENGLEILWSMRMNDTHDAAYPAEAQHPYWSSFKQQHPELLFGTRADRPAFGSWSAVDFASPIVRDFLFEAFREVCAGYDVDGVEMDFFRHLVFFRTVADGGQATDEELEMMTGLVRRIREMTETVGMQRGRPVLLTMRVPDSVEFCRGMGLDIEGWMDEGLIDIVVFAGDFRLNPWEYSVQLATAHGLPVYADLDPAIRRGILGPFNRNSIEAHRGRALNAWRAGVDGIYLFNHFNPHAPWWWELGEPTQMRTRDQLYFVSAMGGAGYHQPDRVLNGGAEHRTLPILHPVSPTAIPAGESVELPLQVGAAPVDGAELAMHLLSSLPEPPSVTLNGVALEGEPREDNWCAYAVPAGIVRPGVNAVEAAGPEAPEEDAEWDVVWECDTAPPVPWNGGSAPGCEARMQDDALLIVDGSTERRSYLYYGYPWEADPGRTVVAELTARVVSGRSGVLLSNGVAEDALQLHPDRIELRFADLEHAMDTIDGFHTYRIEIEGDDIRVYVDGELALDGTGTLTEPAHSGRNKLSFGASSSGTT
ncbi:MAG: family 10 glycosylhydrolase, partial [Armatimonadia bacterium]|nr:family 10 glycosylhydrolase [Armatimonadia bacterium]